MLQEFTDTAIDFTETAVEQAAAQNPDDQSDAPVVKLVSLIITEAVQLRASDIHIEPFEDRVRIRYRIDGRLIQRDTPPRRLLGAILSRIKILAKLDIAERRRPQDGRIKLTADGKDYDLRVSVLPTSHGQSVVMRILDKDNIRVGIRQLGLAENEFRQFKNLIRRPNGIVLVTGPTVPTPRSSPPRTRSSTTSPASTRLRSGTRSVSTSPASSAPCSGRRPT
jgi:type IV pilus assembly protein PilB